MRSSGRNTEKAHNANKYSNSKTSLLDGQNMSHSGDILRIKFFSTLSLFLPFSCFPVQRELNLYCRIRFPLQLMSQCNWKTSCRIAAASSMSSQQLFSFGLATMAQNGARLYFLRRFLRFLKSLQVSVRE